MNSLEELLEARYTDFRSPDDISNLLITLSGSQQKTVARLGLPEDKSAEFTTKLAAYTPDKFEISCHSASIEPHNIITVHNTNYEPNIGYLKANQDAHRQNKTIPLSSVTIQNYEQYELLGITTCMIREEYDEELVNQMIDQRKQFVQNTIDNPPVSQSFIIKVFRETIEIRLDFLTGS